MARFILRNLLFTLIWSATFVQISSGQKIVEVPFTMETGVPRVTVTYRGQSFELGLSLYHASGIDITQSAIKNKFGAMSMRPIGVSGTYSPSSIYDRLKLGNLLIMDLEASWDAPYVLGHNFFANRVVQFDFGENKLRIFMDHSYRPLFDPTGNGPEIAILKFKDKRTSGPKPINYIVTDNATIGGVPAKVLLSIDHKSFENLLASSTKSPETLDVRFGSIVYKNAPVICANAKEYEYVLGIDFLKRFVVTIDLKNDLIRFEPLGVRHPTKTEANS